MCELFVNADPRSYESRTRSVRLHGVVTSIRLEELFWQVLEQIATRDGMGVVQLIEKLYDELVGLRGESVRNFASFLRVCALRHEALLARGRVASTTCLPAGLPDAEAALHDLPAVRVTAPSVPREPAKARNRYESRLPGALPASGCKAAPYEL